MRGINKLSSWNLNYVKKLHISPLFKEFPREIYFRRCSFRSARLNEYEGPMPSFIWFNGSHQTQDRVFFRSRMIGDSDGCKRLSVQSLCSFMRWSHPTRFKGEKSGHRDLCRRNPRIFKRQFCHERWWLPRSKSKQFETCPMSIFLGVLRLAWGWPGRPTAEPRRTVEFD